MCARVLLCADSRRQQQPLLPVYQRSSGMAARVERQAGRQAGSQSVRQQWRRHSHIKIGWKLLSMIFCSMDENGPMRPSQHVCECTNSLRTSASVVGFSFLTHFFLFFYCVRYPAQPDFQLSHPVYCQARLWLLSNPSLVRCAPLSSLRHDFSGDGTKKVHFMIQCQCGMECDILFLVYHIGRPAGLCHRSWE